MSASVVEPEHRGVAVSGEIDIANADDCWALALAVMAGCDADTPLVVDLSGVTFIDSAGLGMLVSIRNSALESGVDVLLRGVPVKIRRLLTLTGLTGVFREG